MPRTATVCGIPWRLENGGCAALPLPADHSIAGVARAHVTGLLPALGLSLEDVEDVALMVSELATNVLQHATPPGAGPGAELWVYQRTDGSGGDELVVKAFDTLREWRGRPGPGGALREHGRGLEIIEILTGGRWGHHPTRSRLRTPAVPGKATWFALPLPPAARRRHTRRTDEAGALKNLHALLLQRGIDHLVPRSDLGVCVLSGNGDLTVWCESSAFRWRTRFGEAGRLPLTDLTEVCERLVRLCAAADE